MDDYEKKLRNILGKNEDEPIKLVGNNRAIGTETGRVYHVKSAEQVEAIERQKKIGRDRRHFAFAHMRNIREVTDNLSNKHCGYILMLQPYIQFKTNILVGKKDEPLDNKGVAKALKITPRTAAALLKSLEQDDVIEITSDGYYKMNERYHFRKGIRSDRDMLVKTFSTTIRGLKLKPAEMGALYKLLPYIHYETNIICNNPFEEMPSKIRFLPTKEIADIMGLHEKKALTVIRELKRAGVVAETHRYSEDLRVKFLVINPYIFYRQSGQPDATLQATFLAQEYR